MNMTTLDDLLAKLHSMKEAGVSGETPIAIPSPDNNGRSRLAKLNVATGLAAVAKDEHAKGWELCRFVARGGVKVITIS